MVSMLVSGCNYTSACRLIGDADTLNHGEANWQSSLTVSIRTPRPRIVVVVDLHLFGWSLEACSSEVPVSYASRDESDEIKEKQRGEDGVNPREIRCG